MPLFLKQTSPMLLQHSRRVSQVLFTRMNQSIIQKSPRRDNLETSHSRCSVPTGICMFCLMPQGSLYRVNCFCPPGDMGAVNGWMPVKLQAIGECLCSLRRFHRDSSSDLTPAYQPPMLVDPSGESNLLQHLRADRGGQGNLG